MRQIQNFTKLLQNKLYLIKKYFTIIIFNFILTPIYLNSMNIKIASYNIENLFDITKDGTEYKLYIPNKKNWRAKMLQRKLNNSSDVICDLNADIISLQEIENKNALRLLQKNLKKVGCEYKYKAITKTKNSSIQIAILSKYKIQNFQDILVKGQRNILRAYFIIDNSAFYIYANHWKSKPKFEKNRILSAEALKKNILTLKKKSKYIILGDFNSNYKNKKTQKTGIVNILNIKYNLKDFIKNTERFIHYNLWLELPEKERWSNNFFGNKNGLDSIILSKNLFLEGGLNYFPNSFRVFKKDYLFHKKGYILRWKVKKGKHIGEGYSDHLPIFANFSTKKSFKELNKNNYGKIKDLYKEIPKLPLYLKNIKVVLRDKQNAIIKESKEGRGIFIYEAKELKINNSYDILVKSIKYYKGLLEITNFSIEKNLTKINSLNFIKEKTINILSINNVYKNIIGIYKNGQFIINGKKYPIYFKNKNKIPKNNTKIKLKKVHIGYFKRPQLVIWDI